MADQQPQPLFTVQNVLLVAVLWTLMEYAPLVPRIVVFCDDVHNLRLASEKITNLQQTASSIMSLLQALEKKFDFFREQAERGEHGRRTGH